MFKNLGDRLASIMLSDRAHAQANNAASINDVNPIYESLEPFALGTYETKETKRRHRKDIYTQWQRMGADPSVAEALSLHVTAALGGHESRGDVVFMTPVERIRGKGKRAEELRAKVNRRSKFLEPIINQIVFKLARDAVTYGDAYVRAYGQDKVGIVDAICNEYTFPPLIQAFEQGGRTIGYHALEAKDWERVVTKLNRIQLLRMKMPRVTHVPQLETVAGLVRARVLHEDIQSNLPIVPSPVGGSFLFEIEEPWKNVHLTLAGLNSQQIADAVKQMFLSVDMSGMPPDARRKYKQGLQSVIKSHEDYVRKALSGGDPVWATNWHVLPSWGEKQVLNPVGDIAGQRTAPINTEYLMLNIRRMMGGLGSDPSMVGWADMLAGGLGDGAAFHTSAQIMRRSIMIRQSLSQVLNQLADLDWGYAYGETFSPADRPWHFEFYSDQSAAASEAITNKQNRINSLALTAQAIATVKELNLDQEVNQMLLEDIGGFDVEKAEKIAIALENAPPPDGGDGQGLPDESQVPELPEAGDDEEDA